MAKPPQNDCLHSNFRKILKKERKEKQIPGHAPYAVRQNADKLGLIGR